MRLVARAFVDDGPRLLARLHTAVDRGDANEVQASAHALKGTVRFFGDNALYDLAYSLETQGRTGNLDRAGADRAIGRLRAAALGGTRPVVWRMTMTKILVVDDLRSDRELMQALLTKDRPWEVHAVENGREALDYLDRLSPT